MDKTVPNRSPNRWFPLLLCILTLTGTVLRFHGLGDRDFWFDESCTFRYVHNLFDWPEDSNLLVESTNLPYYLTLYGWAELFGDSESSYRSLSALAASLTILVLALFARRLAGPTAGVVCAALIAFHPLHIHYAHEARAYALWTLGLSVTLTLLFEATRRTCWSCWAAYGLALVGCLHLHYFTVFLIPATLACAFVADDRRRTLRQWFVTTIAVVLAFVPYFVLAVWPASRQGGSAWISGHWEPLAAIPKTLWAFMSAGGYPAHLRGLSILSPDTVVFGPRWLTALTRVVPLIVVLIVFLLLARKRLHHRTSTDPVAAGGSGAPDGLGTPGPPVGGSTGATVTDYGAIRGAHLFLATLVFGPLLLSWFYSLLLRPNYLPGRYDLIAWPAFMVWLATGITALARGPAGASFRSPLRKGGLKGVAQSKDANLASAGVICLPLIACSLLPIARMAALKPPPTFHNVRAQRLARLCGPDDLVIALSYDRDYLSYYLHRAGFLGRIVSYPSWIDRQVGWLDTVDDLAPGKADLLQEDARARVQLIESATAHGNQVFWLEDFLQAAGNTSRSPITAHLLTALYEAGYQTRIIDADLHILELIPRNDY